MKFYLFVICFVLTNKVSARYIEMLPNVEKPLIDVLEPELIIKK